MELRFYQDSETDLPNIYNLGVSEDETHQNLANPGEDHPAADNPRMVLGQTKSGRYLVIYIPDPENDSTFVITAYELTNK